MAPHVEFSHPSAFARCLPLRLREAAAAAATKLFEATHNESGDESFFADKDAFVRCLARENPMQLAAISVALPRADAGAAFCATGRRRSMFTIVS